MKFHLNPKSITTRLSILSMSVVFLSSLIQMIILSNHLRNDLTELTSTHLVTISQYVADVIDHNISERQLTLKRMSEQFPMNLLHEPEQLKKWLGTYYQINPIFSQGILVINRSGLVIADYPNLPHRIGLSLADRDYFQQAINGQSFIGRPVFGRASKVPVLPMAVPLTDSAGNTQAVLAGISALNSADFIQALYTTRIGTTGGLVLVSPRDRLFVGSSDLDITLQPTPMEGIHQQHDQAMNGFRGVGIDINAGGIEELASIVSIPSSGWFLVARVPTRELFSPITQLQRFILKTTAALIVIFLIVIAIGLRYQLRPLMHAAQHAEQMTQGEIPLKPLPLVRDDEVGHLTAAFNRVLEKLLESRRKMEYLAHHDTLTSLPNRQLFAEHMQQELARANHNNQHIALLFMDLDGFKPINDRLGHDAGDMALREVANRLLKVIRREDIVARIGGDEFVILLSDLDDNAQDAAERVAQACLDVLKQPFLIHGQSCSLGASIGITMSHGQESPDQLMIAADQAMYRAKQAGRGHFIWSDEKDKDQCAPKPAA
ncbi:MAG: diguanylate cyclase [Candidatus Competibacteraceae bacterium]|nr:MAG: diguanylate cyclase [Candidatus Competibacteraceae bacterium]